MGESSYSQYSKKLTRYLSTFNGKLPAMVERFLEMQVPISNKFHADLVLQTLASALYSPFRPPPLSTFSFSISLQRLGSYSLGPINRTFILHDVRSQTCQEQYATKTTC